MSRHSVAINLNFTTFVVWLLVRILPRHIFGTPQDWHNQWHSLFQLGPLPETLLNAVIAGLAVIFAAAVSGYFLLRSHHSNVRDELKIRAAAEQFLRKQTAYDRIWTAVQDAADPIQAILEGINWRNVRTIQTSCLMAGSPDVVQLFNRIMGLFVTEPTPEKDLTKQSLEITALAKELWNVMREELYGAAPLSPEEIKFITPGRKTMQAVEIWIRNRALLESKGITGLEGLSEMDVDAVSQVTGIASEDVADMKIMASRELAFLRESKVA